MYDVITIGSATLDIFVKSDKYVVKPDKSVSGGEVLCLDFGAKIEVESVKLASGGGATNAAVSFTRKGLKAAVIAEVGVQLPASTVISELTSEQVDTQLMIQERGELTSIGVILVSQQGGRSILVYRGASSMLEITDMPWESMSTRWLYVSSLGGNLDLLEKIYEFAQQQKVKVAINPGNGELKQPDRLMPLLKQTEVLLLNCEEAATLLGIDYHDKNQIIIRTGNLGARITAVTDGNEGAHVMSNEQVWFCPPAPEPAVESTGAGDAFGSGLVAGLLNGWDLQTSSALAKANAESVIQHTGAKQGLLSADQLDQLPVAEVVPVTL
jgi:ribokinase